MKSKTIVKLILLRHTSSDQRPLSHSSSWMDLLLPSASGGLLSSSSSSSSSIPSLHFLPFSGQAEAVRFASEIQELGLEHPTCPQEDFHTSLMGRFNFQFSVYTMTSPSSTGWWQVEICQKFKMGKNWESIVQMTLGGPGCRLQTCRRREAQWFDSTFWAALAPRFFAPHQPHPGFQVQPSRFPGFQVEKREKAKVSAPGEARTHNPGMSLEYCL